MGATSKILRAIGFLRSLRTKKNIMRISMDDLVHPRFGINENKINESNGTANSLQFLMYSKENDTLFI
jgi:hypothetical protein